MSERTHIVNLSKKVINSLMGQILILIGVTFVVPRTTIRDPCGICLIIRPSFVQLMKSIWCRLLCANVNEILDIIPHAIGCSKREESVNLRAFKNFGMTLLLPTA
jgi:hypothetical protein